MFNQVRDEPELLAELQKTFIGLSKVESWAMAGATFAESRNYRYADTSGASFPVFAGPTTAGDPIAAISGQIDANVAVLTRQNAAATGRKAFIVRRKNV